MPDLDALLTSALLENDGGGAIDQNEPTHPTTETVAAPKAAAVPPAAAKEPDAAAS